MGSMTHLLYQEMPQYRYVVQDLAKPIDGGKQVSTSTTNQEHVLLAPVLESSSS